MELEGYLEALASDAPTPGGGSAAAVTGAAAAALVAMVARITARNRAFAAHELEAQAIVSDADGLRAAFLSARAADEAAYGGVVRALALPKTDDAAKAARTAAVQSALAGAAEAPLETARLALAALRLSGRAAALGNAQLTSDVVSAAALARAALEAAAANVRANHGFMRDTDAVRTHEETLSALEREAGSRGGLG